MDEKHIKHMVDRFLGWKLPSNFRPDAGISFKADYNEGSAYPMKHEPSGTNLFDANQAAEMVRYMAEGMPDLPTDVVRLVIAARQVAFNGPEPDLEDMKELDASSEAFADRVPWEGQPE